jgi:Ca2+-binding RTX toxin-like protein
MPTETSYYTLTGTTGANIIDGGGGNDTITGSSGADTFKFGLNFGYDTIKDLIPILSKADSLGIPKSPAT